MTDEFKNMILNSPYFKKYQWMIICIKHDDSRDIVVNFLEYLQNNQVNSNYEKYIN